MNLDLRKRALYFLNQMEVIEENGGDSAYAIVENNEENRQLLQEAGIPLETALKYGDGETFCIIALACSEGYATWYNGSELIYHEVSVNEIENKIQDRIDFFARNSEKERLSELELLMNWIASGEDY